MAPRRRPTALEVSFREEAGDYDSGGTTSDNSRKRDRESVDFSIPGAKRRNLDTQSKPPPPTRSRSARKYESRPYEVLETSELLVVGEEPDPPDDDNKRVRVLSRFVFFDKLHENSFTSLDSLKDGQREGQIIHGAGFVAARFEIDEDEGQEDDIEDEEAELLFIQTDAILRYSTDYQNEDCPMYVETEHALYELGVPSKKYRRQYRSFYKPHRLMQLIISAAIDDPEREFVHFLHEFQTLDVLDQKLTERDLWDVVPELRRTLETIHNPDPVRESYVISYLLSRNAPAMHRTISVSNVIRAASPPVPNIEYAGNPDIAVLQRKNQVTTHVTPHIARLSTGLFKEQLRVVGSRPVPDPEPPYRDLTQRVQGFLMRVATRRRVEFRPQQRMAARSQWLKYVTIDGVDYKVGEIIVFPAGEEDGAPAPQLPDPRDVSPSDTLGTYFWFAKIISINGEHETVHVQWFVHSSKTILEELGHPQELFLTDQCGTLDMNCIIGRVEAHYIDPTRPAPEIKAHDYFYRYTYDDDLITFKDVDIERIRSAQDYVPPDNCHVCELSHEFEEHLHVRKLLGGGVAWHGNNYHLNDFVLIKADEGPCHVGQLINLPLDDDQTEIMVKLFGRVDKLGNRPVTTLKDERHLFYTDVEMTFDISDLIDLCYVLVARSMPEIEQWLKMSAQHFFVKYHFPSLNVESWGDRRNMQDDELLVCRHCMKPNLEKFREMKRFLEEGAPLRVFDPFAGVGTFGLAMEEVGCFRVTHAVEISPSAAKTLKKNARPGTKVYNQCSNRMLNTAILTDANKKHDELTSIEGKRLPPPPKPGEIDCIVTGFPCQPHSRLNMFPKAKDKKSNLILSVLSWVDFLKPKYCIFENVKGFLQFNLRSHQRGPYAVTGGIPMGGLKFVIRALLDMGYQFRCGLLQAAHYGTPQNRVRLFIIAAKQGLELPNVPEPTHDFPDSDALTIKFPNGTTIQPIRTMSGIAQHRCVSVHDAISDLPQFHWKHPRKDVNPRQMQEQNIKQCLATEPWCGLQGPNVGYEHEPRTAFQAWCRKEPTKDLQHYTRTYEPKKVERVIEIPLDADADYRSLRPDLWEWQFANPASAVARDGFRPGLYGRVPKDGVFQTTVCNVDPTAKQSRVLHPYCKRIVTVRELARSQGFPDHFVFHAIDDRVVTMHRQIGNAVPWQVSKAIAREFRNVLFEQWLKDRERENAVA
ncbi:S-adenosyl-L-methionine-dependent methyltransferase [Phlebopus sp. FC_14]|nr:S-adenosyl-L-methionine-dependent methyltransferase [Phlebopus sp. FC_14]